MQKVRLFLFSAILFANMITAQTIKLSELKIQTNIFKNGINVENTFVPYVETKTATITAKSSGSSTIFKNVYRKGSGIETWEVQMYFLIQCQYCNPDYIILYLGESTVQRLFKKQTENNYIEIIGLSEQERVYNLIK